MNSGYATRLGVPVTGLLGEDCLQREKQALNPLVMMNKLGEVVNLSSREWESSGGQRQRKNKH
eukprot:scaffold8792_cov182-Ochromonas_danica.AAC.2